MTILAVVKTSTDLIVAADSKITTSALGGKDQEGKPVWLTQTYDSGTKIFWTKGEHATVWTVALAGQSSFGNIQVADIVQHYDAAQFTSRAEQEKDLINLLNVICSIRNDVYSKYEIPEEDWPYTNLLFFSADPEDRGCRSWNVNLNTRTPDISEFLKTPGIFVAGSCDHALTLLYGYTFKTLFEVSEKIKIPEELIAKSFLETIKPLDKINVAVMPVQDAINLAVFLVKTQIDMEKFQPGIANCGGPIDIAVIQGVPKFKVLWYPGKEIHHPNSKSN